MCGIAGVFNTSIAAPVERQTLHNMVGTIRHRGPDEFGFYLDPHVGLGSARLSIVDLQHGQQPISNEDRSLWIVFNGEIFNHAALRQELVAAGHQFSTRTDTEVILHLYEELGVGCLERLNGQFAFAIWSRERKRLFLARDRVGIRPLFYTSVDERFIFGSEIKALLANDQVTAEVDPLALDQLFTYWSPIAPRTPFRGIKQLPAGHYLQVDQSGVSVTRYWRTDFPTVSDKREDRPLDEYLDTFRELIVDATTVRLRGDVPVGTYLSGGLDSSTITAIIRQHTNNRLDTFSVAFDDADFDESAHQKRMARYLGTDHHVVHATYEEIGRVFPEVVWHTGAPILRTSPAPLFLLSKSVRDAGFKVVLTGEGADEFLAGYNIFKEAAVRRFWARQPDSEWRPRLLKRIYPYVAGFSNGSDAMLANFFRKGLTDVHAPDYSHSIRWRNTERAKRFFSRALKDRIKAERASASKAVSYPEDFERWDPLHRAQYLEITTFLSEYLLSSQGDRVAMAHSVEGRFPFLDHRVMNFCNELPPRLKLHGLTEKYLLKRVAKTWLPDDICRRTKRPYRAPIHPSFIRDDAPEYVHELLSEKKLEQAGYFEPGAVHRLVDKAQQLGRLSETDDMALVGVLSSQLLHHQFVEGYHRDSVIPDSARTKVIDNRRVDAEGIG